jgi:hypothetical protein
MELHTVPRSAQLKSSKRIILAGSVLYALIAGCTSQIDSSVDPVLTDGSPNAGGIYNGTIQQDGSSTSTAVTAIFSSGQRFAIYSADLASLYMGVYNIVGGEVTSTNASAFRLDTGATVGTVSFQGAFETQSKIHASYTFTPVPAAVSTTGSLDLPQFQASYKTPSATKNMEGTWDNHDSSGSFSSFLTILGDGTITSGSSGNCNYSGTVTTINVMYNVYKVTMTENCTGSATSSSLSGLASILPPDNTHATSQLVIAVNSIATMTNPAEGRLFILKPALTD